MFEIADPAESEKTKATVAQAKKWSFRRIFLWLIWLIIIIGILFIGYQFI